MINDLSNKKVIRYIILINIFIIITYKIAAGIVVEWDLLFRGWINTFYFVNIFTLFIMGIIFINISICSKLYSKVLKIITTMITAIILSIGCLYGVLFYVLIYHSIEHVIYYQNQKVIAEVSTGFHDSMVVFYEPINIFLMKRSNIPIKTYTGSYDMYKER